MWSSRNSSCVHGEGKAPEASNFAQTCNLLSRYIKEKGSLRDLNLEIDGKVESVEALVKPGSSLSASASKSTNLLTNSGKSAQQSSEKPPSSIATLEDASNKARTSKEGKKKDSKAAQLTIFYSGRVLVFDDYPADKVRELVSVAKKGSSQMSYGITPNTAQEKRNPVASASSTREGLPPRPGAGKQPVGISSNTRKEMMDTAHVGISSNTCKEMINTTSSGAGPSCSKAQEQLSPPSEANGSDLPIARRSSIHRFLEKRRRKDRAAVRGPYQNPEHPALFSKDDEQQLDLNTFPRKD